MLAPEAAQAGISPAPTGSGRNKIGLRSPGKPAIAGVGLVERAGFRDAELLAGVWLRVVHSRYWRSGPERPATGVRPGPEQDKWHMRMVFAGKYFKITLGTRVVGGLLLFDRGRGRYELGLLFVDPRCQGRGIGGLALRFAERIFSDARVWLLDVPSWNSKARAFFEHRGYRRTGRHPGCDALDRLSYEKRRPF